MILYLSIAIGGALGAMGRYWLASSLNGISSINSSQFPTGVFIVNVLGCFLIGVAFIFFSEKVRGIL